VGHLKGKEHARKYPKAYDRGKMVNNLAEIELQKLGNLRETQRNLTEKMSKKFGWRNSFRLQVPILLLQSPPRIIKQKRKKCEK